MNLNFITMAAGSTNYEQMANIFKISTIVLFVLASVCLAFAIFAFITFKIPNVIGDLTGRNARRSIEQMRQENEKGGKKSHRPHPVASDRGTLTEQIKESKKFSKKPVQKQNAKPKPIVLDGSGATDVLEDTNATVNLNYDQNGTEILNEGTQVLSNEVIQSALNETTVNFKLITAIPVGLFTTVFAATSECLAIEIEDVKVYFYGVETLEAEGNKVTYTGGDETISTICVDGSDEVDTTDIVTDIRSIEWIAVICDGSIELPSSEPNVDVDKFAPVITEDDITGIPTEWTKDNVTLTIDATDDGTGVIAYSIDKINWQSENTFEISENNKYTFFAKDAVGNVSEGTTIIVDKIDKEAPIISSVAIDPDTWTNKAVTLIVTAYDEGCGLAENAYKMDDGEWQSSNEFIVDDSEEHIFYVRDKFETEEHTSSIKAKADKHDVVKPTIDSIEVKWNSLVRTPDDFTSKHIDYDFYVNATDDKSGIASYSIDGEEFQESNKFTMKGAGNYTFYVKDNAGNVQKCEYSLKGDDTKPVIDKISYSNENPTNEPITLTVTAHDIDSGLNKKAYKLDNGEWQELNEFVISDCNEHTITVRDAADAENEITDTFVCKNFCDETPTVDKIELSTYEWTNEDIIATVTATGTENTVGTTFSVVAYKMDDGNWQEKNEFVISDCNEHSFYVIDEANNVSKITEESKTIADNYDVVKPALVEGQAVSFEQKNDSWFANLVNKLTFGRFFNERLVITVNVQDMPNETSNASGIVSAIFEFAGIDGKVHEFTANKIESEDSKNGTTVDFVVKGEELPRDFKGTANVILTDAAGNSNTIMVTTKNSNISELPEDSNFMIENTAPTVDSITPSETPVANVYKEDYSVHFKFSDKAGTNNSGIGMVKLEVNGTEVFFNDYQSSETYEEEISVKTDAENKTVNGVEIENWKNGKLTYSISVVDNAGNVSETNEVTYYFDQTAPEIIGFEFSNADDGYYKDENSFDKIYEAVTVIDYGFYFKNTVKVTVSAEDKQNTVEATSTGVKSITVYLKDVDNNKLYTVKADGDEITEISTFDEIATVDTNDKLSFIVPKDFKGQIYAYATDNVDNSPMDCRYVTDNDIHNGFVSPDGSIIETTDKHTDTSSIKFTSIPKAQGTQNNSSNYSYKGDAKSDNTLDYIKSVANHKVPLYNKNITFGVKVTDSYSGIREVSYTIIEGSKTTVKTVRIDNGGNFAGEKNEGWAINKSTKDTNLVTEMTNNIAISGNYNDMVLLVELTDRAGNKSYDYYVFGIDKTAPSIEVEYDNNTGDTQSGTGTYFNANRTATITVSERNFNKENVKFNIRNAEGEVPTVKFVKDIKGTGNGDDSKHIFEVTYSNNGVYSFSMNYTDRATNANSAMDYKNSLAPTSFIVDKTNPTISVSYDNNEAQNDKFFKARRTATITIVEHNFDVNRVVITQTSAISGNAISNPSVSWVNSGDTHTGTINYNADGDYTFDITMTDKAGNKEETVNYGSSVAAKDFTVDTTYSDIVKVDGIVDKGVLGLENGEINADAKINIAIHDVNLDNYNIKLTRSRVLVTGESGEELDVEQKNVISNPEKQCAEDNVDVTSEFVTNAAGTANATATISIPKRTDGVKNDGLYTLTIEAKDKAGNAYDTNANIITFSVNRFGSVFTFGKGLYDLITKNDGYTQSAAGMNLTVYEYNATSIESENVEVISNNDSKILVRDTNYTVAKDTQQTDTSWNKYTYIIKPENFVDDGVYTLRIASKDAASITSQTVDYDICSATFRVDQTPAEIISVNYSTEVNKIAGHNGGSAKAENLTVNFTVEDLIRLEKIDVYVNDMDKPVKTYIYGKDFDDANTFDGGSFEIERNSNEQSFKIVVTDKAGNVIDTAEGDSNGNTFEPGYVFFDHITVTTNQLAIWAKSPVFWGIIGGVAALAVGIVIFIVVKKRKKDDDEENTSKA